MRLSDIIRGLRGIFERKRKNPVQLSNDSNLESNLKPLKIANKSTPIHISEDTVKIQGNLSMGTTDNLYFGGGTDTYITGSSEDVLDIVVGGDKMMQLSESGRFGNEVSFVSSCVGFTQLEPTFNAINTIVDFRHSNKQHLTFGADNIAHLALYFPEVSGNFQLLIKQDGTGSRIITGTYKVYEFDESVADGDAVVKFAGGSNPTLTTDANHVDILSFYWDADNEIAYGVATLDFQF